MPPAHHHTPLRHDPSGTARAPRGHGRRHLHRSAIAAQALLLLLSACEPAPARRAEEATPQAEPAAPAAAALPAPELEAAAQAAQRLITAALDAPLTLDPLTDEAPCAPRAAEASARGEADQRGTRFDAALEEVLLAPGALTINAASVGTWGKRGAALTPEPARLSALIAHKPKADLMLRARMSADKALTAWVATRATFDAAGAQTSGYTLRIEGTSAQLWRVDSATSAQPISPSEPVFQLNKRRAIEIMWWSLGPLQLVQIHDAGTGVELLSLIAQDATYERGVSAAGFPQDHKNRPANGLLSLSARDACAPRGQDLDTPPPRRFLTYEDAAWRALPDALRARQEVREQRGGRTITQSGALALEELYCAGHMPAQVEIEIPWRYIERDMLRWDNLPPVRAAGGGLRADLATYSPDAVARALRATERMHPDLVKLSTIGYSTRGAPILAVRVGRGLPADSALDPRRPVALMLGSHHGGEVISTSIIMDMLQQLVSRAADDPRVTRWLDQLDIWLVPMVNPDGADDFINTSWRAGRKNGRVTSPDPLHRLRQGVDLNRNYPFGWGVHKETRTTSSLPTSAYYRGPSAASEPETKAIMALAQRLRAAAALTYHTGTVSILVPYTVTPAPNPTPNEAEAIAQRLASASPPHPEGLEWRVRKNLYAVDGTDQDWMRHEHGTVALLIEAARRTPRERCERAALLVANRPAWEALLDRMTGGPTLIAQITDAAGAPLADAQVELKEQQLGAGERWTTRADGQYVRFVDASGVYTLRITRGAATSEHPVTIAADQPTHVTIVAP